MKKLLLILVSLALFLSFVGCSQGEETPTDVASATANVQETESFHQQVDESAVDSISQSSVESKPQKTESVADSQESEKSVVSKQSTDGSKAEEELVEEDLEFTTEAQLKNWFKNSTQVANAVSAETLQTMQQGSAITYLRPNIPSNNSMYALEKIVVELSSVNYIYRYKDENAEKLSVIVSLTDFSESSFTRFKDKAENGEANYYSSAVNEIDYYYMRNEESNVTVIRWKQDDRAYSAGLYGHYDQINEILPLLKLEQVTVQTEDDLVTR